MTGPHETTHPEALDAGAYVLGALDEAERLAFEGHLGGCDECRAAVAEISGVPGLLGLVPADVAAAMTADRTEEDERPAGHAPGEPVPTSVLGALMSAVRAQEVRERRRRWVAGLSAAAVLVLGVVVGRQADLPWEQQEPSPGVEQQLELVAVGGAQVPVTATVLLTAVDWGTRIDVTCAYDDQGAGSGTPGYGPSGPYSLVVHDEEGRSEEVATWQGAHGGTITVPGSTGTSLDRIVEVELRDAAGTALLSART